MTKRVMIMSPFYHLTQTTMKRYLQGVMTALLLFAVTSTAFGQTFKLPLFPDVPLDAWFEQDVRNMVEWDVIRGHDDGTFKPADNVNRAELSAMWNRYDVRVNELVALAEADNIITRYDVFFSLMATNYDLFCDGANQYMVDTGDLFNEWGFAYSDILPEKYQEIEDARDRVSSHCFELVS